MNEEEIFNLIRSYIVMVIPSMEEASIKPTDSLRNLDINSMERMEIVTSVMEELSIDVPRRSLLPAQNLGELAKLLHEHLTGKEQ